MHQMNEVNENNELNETERLVQIVNGHDLFHDQHDEACIFIKNEVITIRSRRFKSFLSKQYYRAQNAVPRNEALKQAINTIEGMALHDGKKIDLHNRIALYNNFIWYDLGNGQVVKITKSGWTILPSPILFKRYSHQQKQPKPLKGGDPKKVFEFLNIAEEHELLVLVYIVSCFIPDIPHPIFHPHGSQGAGKTTSFKVIKRLCDPSTIETLITPRDMNILVQTIAHHHICLFDNLSKIPPWMSDILCIACTGGGFSKRQLYTDDEDIIYQVKRCIGINGINLLTSRADLMDRSILLPLKRIGQSQRKEEVELWRKLEKAKPGILGGIFDTLAKAKAKYPKVKLKRRPRMADFARWGCAIAEALGYKKEAFLEAYQANIDRQNEEVVQNSTLAQAVIKLMDDNDEWEGTIKEADTKLRAIANPDYCDWSFPKTSRMLRSYLERIRANLMEYGITFEIGERTNVGFPIKFLKEKNFRSLNTLASQNGATI